MDTLWLQIPVGKDFRLSGKAVKRAITSNTILVVASSPGFPHGVVDHVQDIAQVSGKHWRLGTMKLDGCAVIVVLFTIPLLRSCALCPTLLGHCCAQVCATGRVPTHWQQDGLLPSDGLYLRGTCCARVPCPSAVLFLQTVTLLGRCSAPCA